MSKITLNDSIQDMMIKMSDGNPGAVGALMSLLTDSTTDPDSALGGIGKIMSLDEYGIYGTDVYVFFNDICERDVKKMIGVMRAVQLGLLERETLKDACSRQDRSGCEIVPVSELLDKVRKELPNFKG